LNDIHIRRINIPPQVISDIKSLEKDIPRIGGAIQGLYTFLGYRAHEGATYKQFCFYEFGGYEDVPLLECCYSYNDDVVDVSSITIVDDQS